jgi:hypothetical protein
MSIESNLEQQGLLAASFERGRVGISARETASELAAMLALAAAVAGLWAWRPPHGLAIESAAVCTAVLALATMVRFETPLGFTVPAQLAFVPLLFAVPPPLVPIATVIALVSAQLPRVVTARKPPSRLLLWQRGQVSASSLRSVAPD